MSVLPGVTQLISWGGIFDFVFIFLDKMGYNDIIFLTVLLENLIKAIDSNLQKNEDTEQVYMQFWELGGSLVY